MAVPQEVQDEVNLEYQQRQDELNRALATLKQTTQTQTDQQQQYGQIGDQKLQGVYGDLASQLEALQGRTKDLYAGSKDYLSNLYGSAQQGENDQLQQILASLGSAGAGMNADVSGLLGKLKARGMQQSQGLDRAKVDSLSNIETLGTGQQAVGLQAIGDALKSGASNRNALAQQVLANLAAIQQNDRSGTNEITGQLADLSNSKSTALRVAFNNWQQNQLAASRGGGGGSGGNPLNDIYKMLQIEQLKGKLSDLGTGSEGLQKYFQVANSGAGVSSKLKTQINNIISQAAQYKATRQFKDRDAYSLANTILMQKPGKGQHSIYGSLDKRQKAAIVKALQIYYGK